jgi:hypothetical protein
MAAAGAFVMAGLMMNLGLAGDYADVSDFDFGAAIPAVVGSEPPRTMTATTPTIAKPADALRDLPLKGTSGSGEPVDAAPPRAPSPTPGILSKLDTTQLDATQH